MKKKKKNTHGSDNTGNDTWEKTEEQDYSFSFHKRQNFLQCSFLVALTGTFFLVFCICGFTH